MNNAKLIESFPSEESQQREIAYEEQVPRLRQREGELVTIIDALKSVESSKDWSTLKTEVFDGIVGTLERKLSQEVLKKPLNEAGIYDLQGQLAWARKYANLDSLAQAYRTELTSIRLQLNGN